MIIDFNDTDEYGYIPRVREIVGDSKRGVYTVTFGCQQNEADTERLLSLCRDMGYESVESPDGADLILINTCAIREHAEMKALSLLGRYKALKKQRSDLLIGVCGCIPAVKQMNDRLKESFHYVDFTLEPSSLYKLPEAIYGVITKRSRAYHTGEDRGEIIEGISPLRRSGFKAWLSVMYGCNNFCTYCIVPYTRGRERSRRSEDVINEARRLINDGVKEITLLGQNVNSYCSDMDFSNLIERIAMIDGDYTIRFMTSHPKDVSDRLISVMGEYSPRIAPYFHLPLQSGSDRVLKRMNRTYDRYRFIEVAERLKRSVPGIALSTDVIVGFPGETEADFQDTLSVLDSVRFDSVYAFAYSPRVGTPASRMIDMVDDKVKSDRLGRLFAFQDDISLELNREYLGREERVLIDSVSQRPGFTALSARTYSNKLVHVEADSALIGSFQTVLITEADKYNLIGKLK